MLGKKLPLAGAVALACLLACATVALAATTQPQSQLSSFGCHHALDPAQRKVALRAVMRPVGGTESMAVMFDLLRARKRGAPFNPVHGHGLGKWVHPQNPTLGQLPGDIWNIGQQVTNLSAPALYRFRVHFRWTGSQGHTLAQVTELGTVCYQPELRPDLLVHSITVKPVLASPGTDRYAAVIDNRGATGAGPFEVQLALAGAAAQNDDVSFLGPHAGTRATFSAPACTPGQPVTVTVDPVGAIDDYDRANNTLTVSCPAAGT